MWKLYYTHYETSFPQDFEFRDINEKLKDKSFDEVWDMCVEYVRNFDQKEWDELPYFNPENPKRSQVKYHKPEITVKNKPFILATFDDWGTEYFLYCSDEEDPFNPYLDEKKFFDY